MCPEPWRIEVRDETHTAACIPSLAWHASEEQSKSALALSCGSVSRRDELECAKGVFTATPDGTGRERSDAIYCVALLLFRFIIFILFYFYFCFNTFTDLLLLFSNFSFNSFWPLDVYRLITSCSL